MKFPKVLLRFTLFTTSLTGIRCSYSPPKPEFFSTVKYQLKEKSKQFSDCVKNIHVDTTDYKLRVKFEVGCGENFPFPENDSMQDTLSATGFKFEFFSNGKPITLDRAVVFPSGGTDRSGYYWGGTEIDSVLSCKSDSQNLRNTYSFQTVVPFYAFQNLKAGRQKIEMKISQAIFCSATEQSIKEYSATFKDTSFRYFKNYAYKPMISGTITFIINIPPIYKTVLYGEGLQLQNDTAWSPFGMDNTIWNFPYPDIYYTIYSPREMFYAETGFEKTTTSYEGKDTFNLYHYHPNDTIGISVYDHDYWSRDDWMGSWEGPLEKIRGDYSQQLSFDHIQWFCIHAKTIGVINK